MKTKQLPKVAKTNDDKSNIEKKEPMFYRKPVDLVEEQRGGARRRKNNG